MFNRLRVKLALLNAAVAFVILLAIAGVSYYFISRFIAQQSEQALQQITRDVEERNGIWSSPYATAPGGTFYPYFVLRANESGQFFPVMLYGVSIDESRVNELIGLAIASENDASRRARALRPGAGMIINNRPHRGILRLSNGESFRYDIAGIRAGASSVFFIFMDIRREVQLRTQVLLALGGSVLGGLLLTLLGGLFLAGRALRPVRAAWQKQRAFVADASHELRSPLAAIRCNLDVVLDDTEAKVVDKQLYWEGISEETGRMSLLVDELLLLARADSDAAVLQREAVDAAAVAENAVTFMRPMAEKKGVELKLDSIAQATVTGDPARLKQVLIALIDNAVKYTPGGGFASVSVRRARDKVYIDVRDTGIGIPKEHIGRIFERFYRADKARERESGGYGLGLSIAQWIVQQHGGNISVASEEGKGSCFTVSLPMNPHP
jgi:signal transduction histidine kinase